MVCVLFMVCSAWSIDCSSGLSPCLTTVVSSQKQMYHYQCGALGKASVVLQTKPVQWTHLFNTSQNSVFMEYLPHIPFVEPWCLHAQPDGCVSIRMVMCGFKGLEPKNHAILKYNGIRIALTAVHLHMGGSEPKHKINC